MINENALSEALPRHFFHQHGDFLYN